MTRRYRHWFDHYRTAVSTPNVPGTEPLGGTHSGLASVEALAQPDSDDCEEERQHRQDENDGGANHVGLRDGGHWGQLRTDG